jgi:uncharacterized protein (TIGR03437 family)
MKRVLFCSAAWAMAGWSQQPAIAPGGVVNAASYSAGIGPLTTAGYPQTGGGPTLAGGSIATIFGSNLAASPETAQTLPLPLRLGGTSVSVNGVAAPLLFVSPNQINFQVPTLAASNTGVVVTTAEGQSVPYRIPTGGIVSAPGIFATNSSGCGQGAVLNIAANGNVSLNSPTNSASPGDFISIYGTGNGIVNPAVPDGTPAPSSPLSQASVAGGPLFDFSEAGTGAPPFWVGRAPGLVGVDQFNFIVPTAAREGCTVPLQIVNENMSPPVTISIAKSGGPCVDPPVQGYGDIVWEKSIATDPPIVSPGSPTGITQTITETDTVTISLQASPGRQAPVPPVYTDGGNLPGAYTYFGNSCPIPGYRSLDAGTVTVSGPGLPALAASPTPLPGQTVLNISPQGGFTQTAQVQSGQASGLTAYQAALPAGAIQAGSFTVAASGGRDLGAFQSVVRIGSPIQVTTALAGVIVKGSGPPFTIAWTGGDPDAWVTLKLLGHYGSSDHYSQEWVAQATDHQITIQGAAPTGLGVLGPVEIVLEVVPDPSKVPTLTAPGLSLGGRALWKYTYRFEGATVQ